MEVMDSLESFFREFLQNFDGFQFDYNFGTGAVAVAAYIFMAIGLSAIARNRRLPNPWLAWIPVANLWLLGCICDQYRYVTGKEERNCRKRLLTLGIVQKALVLTMVVFLFGGLLLCAALVGTGDGDAAIMSFLLVFFLIAVLIALGIILLVFSILLQIQRCRAFSDLFASCDPKNKKLLSTASIVASCLGIDLVAALLIFTCRDKEAGMPPRICE